ncbi:MAG TPA: DUF4148 domain-containing protein [Burkholderiaceae bacterium]|nr:DUF4148 domain-containing protein [Burkholderiaceae bacterium]
MKLAYALGITALMSAGFATNAQEAHQFPTEADLVSTNTRAELRDEMRNATEPATVRGKSRAEVVAEAIEAQRLGLIAFGEGDTPIATPAHEEQIAAAGRRAAERLRLATE